MQTSPRSLVVGVLVLTGCAASACQSSASTDSGLGLGSVRALAVTALITWLATASTGAFMLSRWVIRGGLTSRVPGVLPFPFVIAHFSLAITGLLVWVSYVASGLRALAWIGVGVLMVVISLGICTVTLLTPYPVQEAPAPTETLPSGGGGNNPAAPPHRVSDAQLARALADDKLAARLVEDALSQARSSAGSSRWHMTPLIPALHGVTALTTLLLALVTAVAAG